MSGLNVLNAKIRCGKTKWTTRSAFDNHNIAPARAMFCFSKTQRLEPLNYTDTPNLCLISAPDFLRTKYNFERWTFLGELTTSTLDIAGE